MQAAAVSFVWLKAPNVVGRVVFKEVPINVIVLDDYRLCANLSEVPLKVVQVQLSSDTRRRVTESN